MALFTMYADKSQIYVCDQDVFHCDISRQFKTQHVKTKFISLLFSCSQLTWNYTIHQPQFFFTAANYCLTQVLMSLRADNRKVTFSNSLLFLKSLFQTSSRLLQIFRKKQTSKLLLELQRHCVLPMTYWILRKHS